MARKCYATHYVETCDENTVTKHPLTGQIIGCMHCRPHLPQHNKELICEDTTSTKEKAAPTSAAKPEEQKQQTSHRRPSAADIAGK